MRPKIPYIQGEFPRTTTNTLRGRRLTSSRQSMDWVDDDRTLDVPNGSQSQGLSDRRAPERLNGRSADLSADARSGELASADTPTGFEFATLHLGLQGTASPAARRIAWELHHRGFDLLEANETVVRALEPGTTSRRRTPARSRRWTAHRRRAEREPKSSPALTSIRLTQQRTDRVEIRAVAGSAASLVAVEAALQLLEAENLHRNESTQR